MVGGGHEHRLSTYLRAWSGFLTSAVAVAISLQGNYAIATTHCQASRLPVLVIAFAVLVLSAGGGWVSYALSQEETPRPTDALLLTARVNAGFAVLMCLVLLMHLLAGALYAGCEL